MQRLRHFLVSLIITCAASAHAAVVINNLPNGTNGGTTLSDTDWKALLFTTGASSSVISQVTLGLNPLNAVNIPSVAQVEIALFSTTGGVPGAQLATTGLQNVNLTALQQDYTFSISSAFNLAASTQYALVVRSNAAKIKWGNTAGAGTTPTGSGGFSFDTFSGSSDSGASWSSLLGNINSVQISTSASPPTSVPLMSASNAVLMALLLVGAGLWMQRRPVA